MLSELRALRPDPDPRVVSAQIDRDANAFVLFDRDGRRVGPRFGTPLELKAWCRARGYTLSTAHPPDVSPWPPAPFAGKRRHQPEDWPAATAATER